MALIVSHNETNIESITPIEKGKPNLFPVQSQSRQERICLEELLDNRNLGTEASWSNDSLQELPFIDRVSESAKLKPLLGDSSRGNGRLVFVSGEAGIGKTRFAREMTSFARGLGFQYLRAKCVRGPGVPSHALWIELIRQFSEEASARRFFKACGPHFDQIVRVVPELSESRGTIFLNSESAISSPRSTPEEVHHEEMQFFHALTQFFFRLSADAPLFLILDDLQWCDEASLNLLRFFTSTNDFAKSPIFCLCLYRESGLEAGENPALSRLISDLQKQRRFESIQLQRFNSENVAQLIERVFLPGEKTSEELHKIVYSRTGGNPLFVEEVLRCLIEQGAIYKDDEKRKWKTTKIAWNLVPETVKNVIEQRLRYLDDATVDFLRIASVAGEGFFYEVLQRVINPLPGGDRILQSFEKALKTGLIQERQPSSKTPYYVFSDESVKDILYDQSSPELRKNFHAMIAQSLEAFYAKDGEDSIKQHAAELAEHYLSGGYPDKARDYFVKAAKRATTLYAHSEAFANYQSALDLLESGAKESRKLEMLSFRASLLESMGDESQFLPEYGRVFECWSKSALLYENSGALRKAANVYVKLGMAYHLVMYELDKREYSLEKAVLLAREDKETSTQELARLIAYSMISDIWKGDRQKVKEKTALAKKLALESGAQDVLAMTSSYSIATNLATEIDACIESCNNGLRIALQNGFTQEAAFCHFHKAVAYNYTHGPSQESLKLFLDGLDFTSQTNNFMVNLFHKVELVYGVYLPLGEWEKARELADEAMQLVRAFPPNSLFSLIASSAMGHVLLHGGDLDKAQEYLEQVKQVTKGFGVLQLDVPLYVALARLCIEKGEFEIAKKHLQEAYRLSKLRGLTVINGVPHIQLLSLMIEFCLLQKEDDDQFLDPTLQELTSAAKELNEEWSLAYCRRAQGLIASRRRQFSESLSLLQESVALWKKLCWKFELGKTLFELSRTQKLLNDFDSSENSLVQAQEIFSRLGAKIERQKTESQLDRIRDLGRLSRRWRIVYPGEAPRLVFELMIRQFHEDYVIKKLSIDNSGWGTLNELSKKSKLPRSSFYANGSKGGEVFKEVVKSGLVETRVYAGERGRGGNVLRMRIAYDRDKDIRDYVSLVFGERAS